MNPNNPLLWRLTTIFPRQAELLELMDLWYKKYEWLHSMATAAKDVYGKYLLRYGKDQWKSLTALRLYGLRLAVQRKSSDLYDSNHNQTLKNQVWRFLNCQPAGGCWVAPTHAHHWTGCRCQTLMCPWCWMRRYQVFRNMCLLNSKDLAGNINGRDYLGMSLGSKVHVVWFDIKDTDILNSRDTFRRFQYFCHVNIKSGKRLGKKGPVLRTGLRLMAPLVQATAATEVRIGFVYTGDAIKDRRAEPAEGFEGPGVIMVSSEANRPVSEALSLLQPFPMELLNPDNHSALYISRGLKFFAHYGVVDYRG